MEIGERIKCLVSETKTSFTTAELQCGKTARVFVTCGAQKQIQPSIVAHLTACPCKVIVRAYSVSTYSVESEKDREYEQECATLCRGC